MISFSSFASSIGILRSTCLEIIQQIYCRLIQALSVAVNIHKDGFPLILQSQTGIFPADRLKGVEASVLILETVQAAARFCRREE